MLFSCPKCGTTIIIIIIYIKIPSTESVTQLLYMNWCERAPCKMCFVGESSLVRSSFVPEIKGSRQRGRVEHSLCYTRKYDLSMLFAGHVAFCAARGTWKGLQKHFSPCKRRVNENKNKMDWKSTFLNMAIEWKRKASCRRRLFIVVCDKRLLLG